MTELEQKILDVIQDSFPLEERPYAVIAGNLNSSGADCLTEQDVFDVVESLRTSGIIRRIGGVYDSKRLGLVSRLCAGKVPSRATGAADDSALDAFAETVLKIPAITHNYVRSHEYNVWFTVIGESEALVQKTLDGLMASTSLRDVHALAANKMFKINTVMKRPASDLQTKAVAEVSQTNSACFPSKAVAGTAAETLSSTAAVNSATARDSQVSQLSPLTDSDKRCIYLASGDIPHSLTPFDDLGIDCSGLQEDLRTKRMRRFGAILRHQEAGFAFNAMVCFNINDCEMDVETAGPLLARTPFVSHCYDRSAFEGFPYNLYAMMHAQTEEELQEHIQEAVALLGHPDYAVLKSLRELKKTSYRHFAESKESIG